MAGGNIYYADGNVGIGMTSPDFSLDVAGSARVAESIFTNFVEGHTNSPLYLRTNSNTRISILAGGSTRVGINKEMANSELDVQGGIRTSTAVSGGEVGALELRASGAVGDVSYMRTVGTTTTLSTKIRFDLSNTRFFGDMGIGRAPTVNRLEVEGNASKSTAGNWLANSDARIKTDVVVLRDALATLKRVRPVRFRYTDGYRAEHPEIRDHAYYNVIAQEFREVFPDYVKGSGERLPNGEEILQVDTYPLAIFAAAAVQELDETLAESNRRIRELESRNAAQQSRIDHLEARLDALERSSRLESGAAGR